MESSKRKSGSVEISKKNRSLDLKSLYESKFSEVRGNKKKVSDENDGENVRKKKRKSRKEVPLTSFESGAKRSRKEDVNGVKPEVESAQKLKGGVEGFHDISLPLGNNGSSFNIPKRPRGSVGRKRLESDQGSEPTRRSDSTDSAGQVKAEVAKPEDGEGPKDRLVQLATPSSGNECVSSVKSKRKVNGSNSNLKQKSDVKPTMKSSGSNVKLMQKVGAEGVKEKRNGESGSACVAGMENNQVVKNRVASPKRQLSNSRKKKDLALSKGRGVAEASAKKSQPSVGSSSDRLFIDFVDDDDDDEENLEQNAARMLSSRFDPSCTGFSSKKSSVSHKADGVSFSSSSAQGTFTRRARSLADGPSASADDQSRTLRPRRGNAGKGVSRKRRHFYEILAQDLDPHWVLNRRIKIFWPLDESWYYGLVNDYNSETKHHQIKYDDREEEIVNLLNEKFKLLLLPSEVPDKFKSRKRSRMAKDLHSGQTAPSACDDSCMGDPLDSEPIASWLASQSQRAKASPRSLKRQKSSQKHLPLVSSLSSEKTGISNSDVVESTVLRNNADCESASEDSLINGKKGNSSLPESTNTSQSDKHVVYVRRKYRKTSGGGNFMSRDAKAFRTSPWTVRPVSPVSVGLRSTKGDSVKLLWSFDDEGKITLNDFLLDSDQFKLQICLPVLRSPWTLFDTGNFLLLHDIFMLQHGVLVASSPAVFLEMLFIDTSFGMKFVLYEGCLKQAVALIFQILIVFSEFDEQWNSDMKLPVTSIRFQLSSSQDPRKQYAFAFYSFSKLKSSKWLYLDSKMLKHCFLLKQLTVSECTYDNIKEFEYRNFQSHIPYDGSKRSLKEGVKKKFVSGILPMGISREARNKRMSQSAFTLAAKPGKVPQFALSFSAAPTFFLTLHLQQLMEQCFGRVNLLHQDAVSSTKSSDDICQPDLECAHFEPRFRAFQCGATHNGNRIIEAELPGSNGFCQDSGMGAVLPGNAAENAYSSKEIQRLNPENDGRDGRTGGNPSKIISQPCEHEPRREAHQLNDASGLSSVPTSITSQAAGARIDSTLGGLTVEIPSSESRQASDVDWNVCDGFVHKSNTIGFRSSWQNGGSNSVSSPFGHTTPVWPDGSPNFKANGFSNGPKKPRTQVQYTLPFVGCDLSEKQKSPSTKSLPCKRIRKASLKRISDGSGNNRKNVELLSCVANVLVTHGDKGWREYGAHIVLEGDDHSEWRLTVKLSGVTKYSYKVQHILQPGSTNRYSHAMMWKGGKDWVLEFPDRSQWTFFKEMHEECHNRNIRAASVKNIPIPGVRLVEDSDDHGNELPFVRNPMMYLRQVQNDVEMAMDPSHILYDMDSDDEEWLMAHNSRADKHDEISEESLEKAIAMFEKVSYSQHQLNFTDDEIEKLLIGMGLTGTAKVIHQYWREKREKVGMSLIRHLQPPLWERYQQKLKDWEHNSARGLYAYPAGRQGNVPPEKPPMFAFCLRPRGLEVPNKGSKQRSHRRLPVSGHHHASLADQDGLIFGRRSNGHAFGDEKMLYASSIHHDSSDVSPSLRSSMRVLSPRDAHFYLRSGASDWKGSPKFYKNKSKKLRSYPSFNNQQMMAYTPRSTIGKRSAIQQWDMVAPESPGQRPYFPEGPHRQGGGIDQLNSSDLHEFRLRDACGAAQHARKLARFKRENAQRLFRKADVAVHKAVLAVMAADAVKDPISNSIDIK